MMNNKSIRIDFPETYKQTAKHKGLNSKQIEKEKILEMFSEFGGSKNAVDHAKRKNKK